MTYSKAQDITRGKGGAIQAHHLAEQRFLEKWGFNVRNAPAIILTKEQHNKITRTLRSLLPYGQTNRFTKQNVWKAYQQAYEDYPEYLKAIEGYFK